MKVTTHLDLRSPKIKADSSRNLAVFTAQLENTVELAEAVHYG